MIRALGQVSILMIAALIISIPLMCLVWLIPNQKVLAYIVVIALRLVLETFQAVELTTTTTKRTGKIYAGRTLAVPASRGPTPEVVASHLEKNPHHFLRLSTVLGAQSEGAHVEERRAALRGHEFWRASSYPSLAART